MTEHFTAQRTNREALRQGGGKRLHQRAHALEEAFFAKRERALVEALRQKLRHERESEELARECGIGDLAKVEALVACGIRAETLPALILTPLVAVAWADGEIEPVEREDLVRRALQHRIVPGSAPWDLLQSWLSTKPPDALFEAWAGYAREISRSMTPSDRRAFSDEILEMVRAVAEHAREHRHFNREKWVDDLRVLDRIEQALSDTAERGVAAESKGEGQ